jgi:hypothetical protein
MKLTIEHTTDGGLVVMLTKEYPLAPWVASAGGVVASHKWKLKAIESLLREIENEKLQGSQPRQD